MAGRYGAGQYESAFSPRRLQNWSVARPGRQRPSPHEGSTPIISNDRGHLLPTVPRSQASPWGSFVGTWEMPTRIPPARLDLSSRSAAAAARLTDRARQPTALTRACNGLRTRITGKPQLDAQAAEEPSRKSGRASGDGIRPPKPSPATSLEEPPGAGAAGAAPLSPQPSRTEVRPEADTSPEPPAARQPCSHQPAETDRCGDAGSPEIPASVPPAPKGASPQPPSPGGSAEAEPGGCRSPGPVASPCAVLGEAAGVGAGQPPRAGL
ncbi:protein Flattop [Chlamydotis macqueenii]